MKKAASLLGAVFLSVVMNGCSSSVAMPASQAEFQLFVDVTPKEAVIMVDDAVVSSGKNTAEVPLKILAGTRRITILCDGYHPFRTTLEYIQAGEVYTLKTSLIASEF